MPKARRRRRMPSRAGELRTERAAPTRNGPIRNEANDRKCLALCAQVRRALEIAIAADCRDEILNELTILDVWPDPTTRRLRVWVAGPNDMDEWKREQVLQRLSAARGFLRAQVATAIHRKRTPELVFELVSGTRPPEGDPR
jgi:ribosome-binding factor A